MNAADVVAAIEKVTEVITGIGTQLGAKAAQFEKDAEPLAAAIFHAIAGGMTEQDKANLSAKRKIFAHVYIDDRNLGVSKVFKNGITLDDELISELGIPFGEGEKFMKKVVSLYA